MAAQFKVGGKVVCVEGGVIYVSTVQQYFTYIKGQVYTVHHIHECACGAVDLCLGDKKKEWPNHVIECSCGKHRNDENTYLVYVASEYFVPIEEQEAKTVTYTKKPSYSFR